MSKTSGLSPRKRRSCRRHAIHAAFLCLGHAEAVHYTQGAKRWEGIDKNRRSAQGEYPRNADCSSFVTWCIWNALTHFGVKRDLVNGENWKGGYTGTMVDHGIRVRFRCRRGDAVIYGGGEGEHTAIVHRGGFIKFGKVRVVSHGSEGGPYDLPMDYRSDRAAIRRYI